MPAAGSKGAARNPSELKDDTSLAREEKQVPVGITWDYLESITCLYE